MGSGIITKTITENDKIIIKGITPENTQKCRGRIYMKPHKSFGGQSMLKCSTCFLVLPSETVAVVCSIYYVAQTNKMYDTSYIPSSNLHLWHIINLFT